MQIKPILMKKMISPLLVVLLFSNCSKTSTSDPVYPDDVFYFQGVINGISYKWTQTYHVSDQGESLINFGTQRGVFAGSGQFWSDCGNIYCKQLGEAVSIYSEPTVDNRLANALSVQFEKAATRFDPDGKDVAEVRSWLDPGMKSFAFNRRSSDAPIHDGVFINYSDANSEGWDSSIEWGDQDGSSFESIELKDATPDKPYLKTWKASFSCKLFQHNGCVPGAPTKVITISGELYVPVFARNN